MQHATHLPHAARFPTLTTTPLAQGTGQARWLPEARDRRRTTGMARRLALTAIMVATFALGTAVMFASVPTAEQTGEPPQAPAGL